DLNPPPGSSCRASPSSWTINPELAAGGRSAVSGTSIAVPVLPGDERTERWHAGETPRGRAPAPAPAATLVAHLPRRHGGQLCAHAGARPRAELRQHSLHALQGAGAGGQRRGGDQPGRRDPGYFQKG